MASEKKKRSVGNTLRHLPTGARITILVIGIFGLGAGFLTFNAFSSDDADIQQSPPSVAGDSRVDLGAKQASGFKVGAEKILDDKSPMAMAEKEAREAELAEAKTKRGGGYMAPLEISQDDSSTESRSDFIDDLLADVDQKAKNKLDEERASNRVPNGLDDVMDRETEEQLRQQRLKNMEAEIARSSAERNEKGQRVVYQKKSVRAYQTAAFSNPEAINSEKERATKVSQKVLSQAASIAGGETYSFTGGGGSSNGPSVQRGGGSSGSSEGGYNPADDPSNPAYYDPYVNNERHTPQPDYEGLSNARDQVLASMGTGPLGPQDNLSGYSGSQGGGGFQFASDGFNEQGSPADYGYPAQAQRGSSDVVSSRPYKAIGDVCYGKLKMNINSDTPTPVRVQFLDRRCNKLFKAIAIAQPARAGEHITLQFKGMKLNGKTQKINAIALDPDSESALFQDDIDRHIFSRYISLAAAAALPGWSDAVTGVDVEEDDQGNVRERRPPVDALSDQLAVVAGSIGDALVPVLQSNFERPPTVKVFNNKDILIMFMGDFHIEP